MGSWEIKRRSAAYKANTLPMHHHSGLSNYYFLNIFYWSIMVTKNLHSWVSVIYWTPLFTSVNFSYHQCSPFPFEATLIFRPIGEFATACLIHTWNSGIIINTDGTHPLSYPPEPLDSMHVYATDVNSWLFDAFHISPFIFAVA